MFTMVPAASAQYSTNFDNDNNTDALSDAQDGWGTNDAYTGSYYNPTGGANTVRYIGSSDGLTSVANVNGGNTSNLQAFVGGAENQNNGFLPGTNLVYVNHPTGFAATQSFQFNTDFVVTAPASSTDSHDNFGFSFQSTKGTSLFQINFTTPNNAANNLTFDDVTYSVGNNATQRSSSFSLNSRYKLTVSVNVSASTFSASYVPENQNGTASTLPSVVIASGVQYFGTVSQFAAIWGLNNATTAQGITTQGATDTNSTAFTGGGTNVMLFDNLSTTALVPEPSTYVLLGFGALGLGLALRSRRNQHA